MTLSALKDDRPRGPRRTSVDEMPFDQYEPSQCIRRTPSNLFRDRVFGNTDLGIQVDVAFVQIGVVNRKRNLVSGQSVFETTDKSDACNLADTAGPF